MACCQARKHLGWLRIRTRIPGQTASWSVIAMPGSRFLEQCWPVIGPQLLSHPPKARIDHRGLA